MKFFDNDKSQCGPFGTSTHDGHSTLFQKLELGVRIIQNSDIKEIEKAPTDLSLQPLIGLNVNESNFFVAKSHGCISI
jgi:hypothetical protein